jgi:hypothetical protein
MSTTERATRRRKWLAGALPVLPVALLIATSAPSIAATDPLAAAYAVAFANPTNVEAQLVYARAAEAAGKIEAAFPVYERVLSLQPGNAEAQAALRRIRNEIQPSRQDRFAEFGVAYETNPLQAPSGANPELQLFGNLALTDERALGDRRWRTVGRLNAVWHGEQRDLNYGYAGGFTGPLIDLGANSLVHAALGGGVSSFGGRLFYTEALANLTFEAGARGATQTLRLRGAYRTYDPFWVSTQGFWADLTGRFIWPQVQSGGALIVTPWLRWTDVGGTALTGFDFDPIAVTPGRYVEAGARAEYLHDITNRLSAGLNVTGSVRRYTSDVVPFTTTNRQDVTFSPGAALVLSHLHSGTTDIRLRYNFIINDSNDDDHDYRDHIVALSVGTKF